MITAKLNNECDLQIDASGNPVMITGAAAQAQGIAGKVKLFAGEAVYNLAAGQPWLKDTLGLAPPEQIVVAHLENAALQVKGVTSARATILSFNAGIIEASIEFTTDSGENGNVTV